MWRSWHWSFWVLLCSKRRNFGAQLVEFGRHRADRGGHLGFGEARGDVLRAIPFPADDVDEEGALGRRAIGRGHQRGDRGGIVGELDDRDRKSVVEGKSVSVRVELGGRRTIKKKKKQ